MIHHHSHPCPLIRHESGNFTCDGCGRSGRGSRYRCDDCDFDLHLSCATYTFPCHSHPLRYHPRCASGTQITCDVCNTRVCGAHYGCRGCDFQVHPNCVQRRTTGGQTSTGGQCTTTPRPCCYCRVYCVYCVRCNPRRRC